MLVGSHQCSLRYLPGFPVSQMQFCNMETSFLAKRNYHEVFQLRAGGERECPYSQYFPYPFLFCEFPRFSAARRPAKLIFCSQAHNCCGEPGSCCAGPCNPDCQIQNSTK